MFFAVNYGTRHIHAGLKARFPVERPGLATRPGKMDFLDESAVGWFAV